MISWPMLMWRLLGACLVAMPGLAAPQDAGHPISMWRIEGSSNRIYLLGSVHVLRAQDHPIPSAIESAYEDAEVLIMEVDMDDLDPVEMAGLVNELGVIGDGTSLQEVMGQELYAEAADYASQLNIPIAMLGETEPWLAAITVEQMMLLRIGFDPQYGIEFHLSAMAGEDEKQILGFETAREQLELLDGLSLPAQRSLLIQTLKDSLSIEEDLNLLISAWRHGDIGFLEKTLLAEMQQYPELYKTLVVDRNQAWVERIKKLTAEKDDYLVVVGALHLVGEDGVPALLSRHGISVDQLSEPES
jgi:uncharacterized protein YbaP (TraB family)